MPRKLRRLKARPARVKPAWRPSEEQRAQLAVLLGDVDVAAGERAPAFLALLNAWRECQPPWDICPLPHAYLCRGGVWLIESVGQVVGAIRQHVDN